MSGPVPTGRLRMLSISMREIATRVCRMQETAATSTRSDGRPVVNVMPLIVGIGCFPGFSADGMKSHITKTRFERNQAESYRNPDQAGKVFWSGAETNRYPSLIRYISSLSITPSSCFKMNPVNAYLGPVFAEILEPLIELGLSILFTAVLRAPTCVTIRHQ